MPGYFPEHISAHAQYCNFREAFRDSLLATEIPVASGIVIVPPACCNLDFLHLMHKRTLKILLLLS